MWIEDSVGSRIINSEHVVSIELVQHDSVGGVLDNAVVLAHLTSGKQVVLFRDTPGRCVAFIKNLEMRMRIGWG